MVNENEELFPEEEAKCDMKPRECTICQHKACGWCPECSPLVPEW